MIQTFKRIGTIKAIQWTGYNFDAVKSFVYDASNNQVLLDKENCFVIMVVNEKAVVARTGDWVYYSMRGNLKMITNDKLRRKYIAEKMEIEKTINHKLITNPKNKPCHATQ